MNLFGLIRFVIDWASIHQALISFPRKRALELRFIRQESVHKALNWIRVKAGKPQLRIP
ncbi:MAG: hypothetical protein ABSA71_07420 [Desulfomonilia bacterium]|jgi:hypothetical protein